MPRLNTSSTGPASPHLGPTRRIAHDFRSVARSHALLGEERERQLTHACRDHADPHALEELLMSHARLVARIARRHVTRALSEEELVAEGMLGLVEAARRFEPSFGVRFSTYAAHWVRAYVQRHTLANRRIVGMPDTRAARRVLGRLGRTESQLSARLGRAASEDELAEALGVKASDVCEVRTSLSARDPHIGLRGDHDPEAFEPAFGGPSPEDDVAEREIATRRRDALFVALDGLPARERTILEERMLSDAPPTLGELAGRMGLSRERVRQLEARALRRLRDALVGPERHEEAPVPPRPQASV